MGANVTKERMKAIKAERRTLKNRGYASSCRIKREKEVEVLEEKISQDRKEIEEYDDEIFSIKQATEALDKWFEQMDPILEHMQAQLHLSDHRDRGYDSEVESDAGGIKNEEEFKQEPPSPYVYPPSVDSGVGIPNNPPPTPSS